METAENRHISNVQHRKTETGACSPVQSTFQGNLSNCLELNSVLKIIIVNTFHKWPKVSLEFKCIF